MFTLSSGSDVSLSVLHISTDVSVIAWQQIHGGQPETTRNSKYVKLSPRQHEGKLQRRPDGFVPVFMARFLLHGPDVWMQTVSRWLPLQATGSVMQYETSCLVCKLKFTLLSRH